MMTLEPKFYSSFASSYNYDLDFAIRLSSPLSVDSSRMRVMMLNTAYNGDVVWKFQEVGSSTWKTIYTSTGFDGAGVVDATADLSSWRVQTETTGGTVIATSGVYTETSADAGMGMHINLIGTSGSEQIIIVRGCGTAGSNCNSCSSSSNALEVWVIVVIVVAAVLVTGSAIGLTVWCCNKSDSAESGHGSDVQESNPTGVVIQDTTNKELQTEEGQC